LLGLLLVQSGIGYLRFSLLFVKDLGVLILCLILLLEMLFKITIGFSRFCDIFLNLRALHTCRTRDTVYNRFECNPFKLLLSDFFLSFSPPVLLLLLYLLCLCIQLLKADYLLASLHLLLTLLLYVIKSTLR
jgi:hypothetical protein